jgi:hypothetical protein
MADQHTDLRIRIRAWEQAHKAYPAEVETDDGRHFEGELRLDRKALLPLELDPRAYGLALFDALFAGQIRRAYDMATARADAVTEGRLRVQLWIEDEAVELHALPWERLYHESGGQPVPLAATAHTPFSRYIALERARSDPVAERPIKILAVVSNPRGLPGGLPPVDMEAEIGALYGALGDLRANKEFQVTLVPGRGGLPEKWKRLTGEGYQVIEGNTTLKNLLAHMPGQHVFHFIGHGAFRRASERGAGQAALYLEKDDGAWEAVRDDDLVTPLAAIGESLPRLALLVACESAKQDAEHPLVGLGPKLVRAGIPAVAAMQDKVRVEAARTLTGEFYRRLTEHGEVDLALNQARLLLFNPGATEWAVPVLFLRLKQGKLFARPEAAQPPQTTIIDQSGGITFNVGEDVNVMGDNVLGDKVINMPGSGGASADVPDVAREIAGGDDLVLGKTRATTVSAGGGLSPGNLSILIKQFGKVHQQIDALPESTNKQALRATADKILQEAGRGSAADAAQIEAWLRHLDSLSPNVRRAAAKALTNPAARLPPAVRLVGEKMK